MTTTMTMGMTTMMTTIDTSSSTAFKVRRDHALQSTYFTANPVGIL